MANKTYLQLVNLLASEAGITSSSSSVSTVVGQTGTSLRLVNWVKQAYNEIQNRHTNWRWLRSKWTVSATVGDDTYAGTDCTDSRLSATVTRFAHWIPFDDDGASNIKRYLTSGGVSGEVWMTPIPWSYFMAIYKRGTQNNGIPIHAAIDPQNNLVIGPAPDGTYTLSGEYQMSSKILAADADTTEWHERFDDLIVFKAMEKYGRFYSAPEVIERGQVEGRRLMRQLENDQLPAMGLGEPIA